MAKRREERIGALERWQRRALLGLGQEGLTETETMDWLLDGDPARLAPLWAHHRARLIAEWEAMHGRRPHPMDRPTPSLSEPPRGTSW
jgi:hypothetical protein